MNDKDEPMKNIQGFKLGVDLQSQNHPFSSNYFIKTIYIIINLTPISLKIHCHIHKSGTNKMIISTRQLTLS